MENREARTLHPQAREELRRRAIKMLNQGLTQRAVAGDLDVTRQAVGKWWTSYLRVRQKRSPMRRAFPLRQGFAGQVRPGKLEGNRR